MTKYKFQLNGIIEFHSAVTDIDVIKVLHDRVAIHGTYLVGHMIHEIPEPKKRIGKKKV